MNVQALRRIANKLQRTRKDIIKSIPEEAEKPYMDALIRELEGVEASLRNRIALEVQNAPTKKRQ